MNRANIPIEAHWGRWFKARLRHLRISQREVARATGVTPAVVVEWTKREHLVARPRNWPALAQLLGVASSQLPYAYLNHMISPQAPDANEALRRDIRNAADRLTGDALRLLHLSALSLQLGDAAVILAEEAVASVQKTATIQASLQAGDAAGRPAR